MPKVITLHTIASLLTASLVQLHNYIVTCGILSINHCVVPLQTKSHEQV